MQALGGAFTPNREVDELRWLPPEARASLLTRATDREILERFDAGPARTATVLLVRHASAGDRDDWEGDDRVRPLDEIGHDQAEELVRLLSRFEVAADRLGRLSALHPDSEAARRLDRAPSRGGAAALGARLPGPRVGGDRRAARARRPRPGGRGLQPGEVIPDIVQRLAAKDGVELAGPAQVQEGERLGAQLRRPRSSTAAEYFPPPDVT